MVVRTKELPTPAHFDKALADKVWRVPYRERAVMPANGPDRTIFRILPKIRSEFA